MKKIIIVRNKLFKKNISRAHQQLGEIDLQESKDGQHEGRRSLFGLTGPGLGFLLHHWLFGLLLLLWLILLLLVLCAVFKKQFVSVYMTMNRFPLTPLYSLCFLRFVLGRFGRLGGSFL